ncbi:hypothetical protein KM043_008179 [Ampulex compressa]|nr:hypothetical protein KM043_008179 [Ampulex compressa]
MTGPVCQQIKAELDNKLNTPDTLTGNYRGEPCPSSAALADFELSAEENSISSGHQRQLSQSLKEVEGGGIPVLGHASYLGPTVANDDDDDDDDDDEDADDDGGGYDYEANDETWVGPTLSQSGCPFEEQVVMAPWVKEMRNETRPWVLPAQFILRCDKDGDTERHSAMIERRSRE